jgi:enediyne biosynthesis protein E4
MVTSAIWQDFNNDKQPDLIIAGEWMPVLFFANDRGKLIDATASTGLTLTNGMWRSLLSSDIDNDGDLDIIAGNLGLNCEYESSSAKPMQLYATDYDGNGSIDPFFFYYIKAKDGSKKLFPAMGRGRLAEQVPMLKKKYLLNENFSHATYEDLFAKIPKDKTIALRCEETRSVYFENLGNGKFLKHILPMEAQFSPVNAILCDDFNGDGFKDLLLAGNEYQTEVSAGRYDASFGCFLKGDKSKSFQFVPNRATGFTVVGDVKDMQTITMRAGNKLLLVGVNNDSMRVFQIRK